MSQKATFIQGVIGTANTFGQQSSSIDTDKSVYGDRNYAPGEADEITQGDLEPFGIQLADFSAMLTLMQQMQLFLKDGTPAKADYCATINKVRSDT